MLQYRQFTGLRHHECQSVRMDEHGKVHWMHGEWGRRKTLCGQRIGAHDGLPELGNPYWATVLWRPHEECSKCFKAYADLVRNVAMFRGVRNPDEEAERVLACVRADTTDVPAYTYRVSYLCAPVRKKPKSRKISFARFVRR